MRDFFPQLISSSCRSIPPGRFFLRTYFLLYKLLTHRRFFISSYIFWVIHRRFFTKFISSHVVLGIHGRSFLYNGVLPYEILIHRELFLHNYFLLHRLFNFPDAPSQKNSSIPYFPYIGQRAEKDQMYFHTSDLDHNFKFPPILDKEPKNLRLPVTNDRKPQFYVIFLL